jgi:hypothetical protein
MGDSAMSKTEKEAKSLMESDIINTKKVYEYLSEQPTQKAQQPA